MYRSVIILILFWAWLKIREQRVCVRRQCIEYGFKQNCNDTICANNKLVAGDEAKKEVLANYLSMVIINSVLDDRLRLQQRVISIVRVDSNALKVPLTQQYASNAIAQLDQVLYDSSMVIRFNANKYNKQWSNFNRQQIQELIPYYIGTSYIQIFVSHRQLKQLESGKKNYNKRIKIFGLRVNKGVVFHKNVDQVDVEYNNNGYMIRIAQKNLGGLTGSVVLTLFVIPSIYLFADCP